MWDVNLEEQRKSALIYVKHIFGLDKSQRDAAIHQIERAEYSRSIKALLEGVDTLVQRNKATAQAVED